MGQPLTLDEVGVSEEDAARVIYELRQDRAKLRTLLQETHGWFKYIVFKAPVVEDGRALSGNDMYHWEMAKVEALGKLVRQINQELNR